MKSSWKAIWKNEESKLKCPKTAMCLGNIENVAGDIFWNRYS